MIHPRDTIAVLSVAVMALTLASCSHLPGAPEGQTDSAAGEASPQGEAPAGLDVSEPGAAVTSEAPPSTDIFLVDFDSAASPWRVVEVQRLTDRDGYDNQPSFEPDATGILYASMSDGQTDIFRYRVDSGEVERLGETAESEYSPTPIPGWPGFSTVRVEADGTQRLWRFPGTPGAGRGPELLLEDIAPVGYHAWIDAGTVALFVLGEPPELVVASLESGQRRVLAADIGRALHGVPGRSAVSFVDKSDPDRWFVSIVETPEGDQRSIVETPEGSEDFIWWSSHELLIGAGSKLLVFDLDAPAEWREVADLAGYGVTGITRLSRSPRADRLAVVGERSDL